MLISNSLTALARVILVCIMSMLLVAAPSLHAQDDEEEEETKTLDPRVAEDLLGAYEKIEAEEYQAALSDLNKLLDRRGDRMKPFDKASVLQVRGSAHVNLDDLENAVEDFAEAISLDALPTEQQNRLRYNVAQIYFVNERYEDALRMFDEWMKGDVEVTETSYFMIAAAHYNLDQLRDALDPIKKAIELSEEPEQRYYDLQNAVYSRLEMTVERTVLLEEMVQIWTDDLGYWRQLSSLYAEQDQQMKAFSTLETAYVNGLIEEEKDIILLAQYYSTFENPHRGGQLLANEMDKGNVEKTVENLELLSQLWSQAREHGKAIPVLREAASLSEKGSLSFRLGQALLSDENYEAAEDAFETALDKGGLDDERRAETWILLGNARFSQAGPGDRELRESADEAFAQAEKFASTRRQASDWRGYLDAITKTERRQEDLEREQSEQLASAARERLLTGCRAQQLAGSELSERCKEIMAEAEEQGDG